MVVECCCWEKLVIGKVKGSCECVVCCVVWLLVRVSEEVVECGCWLVEVVIGE